MPEDLKPQKLFRVHPDDVRTIVGCPKFVLWSKLLPFEGIIERNHSQSLQRLNERGGLSLYEIYAAGHGLELRSSVFKVPESQVLAFVQSLSPETEKTESQRLQAEVDRLRAAIRKHRDASGHDRCWLNDRELYAALTGEPVPDSPQLPCRDEFMANCARYYEEQAGDVQEVEGVARYVPPAPTQIVASFVDTSKEGE